MKAMEPVFVVFGYVCFCGERVKVFHVKPGANLLLHPVSVSCAKGHTAIFRPDQLASLELWADETNTVPNPRGGEARKKTA